MEDLVNSTSKVNKWTYLGDEQWSEMNDLNQVLAVTLNGESIDDIVSLSITPGIALDPVKDHLGSIHAWVNADTGAIEQKQKYSAYGETTVTQSSPILASLGMLRGFTGRELDQDTKFQHNRARWYDANTGRWLSQDPIGLSGGDTNFYRYVNSSSSNRSDPSGNGPVSGIVCTVAGYTGNLAIQLSVYKSNTMQENATASLIASYEKNIASLRCLQSSLAILNQISTYESLIAVERTNQAKYASLASAALLEIFSINAVYASVCVSLGFIPWVP